MNSWPDCNGRQVLKALLTIGWDFAPPAPVPTRAQTLQHPYLPAFHYPFGDTDLLGSVMLTRIASYTGLQPEDL